MEGPATLTQAKEDEPQLITKSSSRKIIRRGPSAEALLRADENGGTTEVEKENAPYVNAAAVAVESASLSIDSGEKPAEETESIPKVEVIPPLDLSPTKSAPASASAPAPALTSADSEESPIDTMVEMERGRSVSDAEEREAVFDPAEEALVMDAIAEEENADLSYKHVWPASFMEEHKLGPNELPPSLDMEGVDVVRWVLDNKKLSIRTVTWNLCARAPPPIEATHAVLLPQNKYHVYVIGTEECERSIAQSALNPSKKVWERYLGEALGPRYVPIKAHTLQAIHMMVFVHKSIAHMCSEVTSGAVPTGLADTLGNKGGVVISMRVGKTQFALVNVHLAAHQNKVARRNIEFHKLNSELPALLQRKQKPMSVSMRAPAPAPAPAPAVVAVEEEAAAAAAGAGANAAATAAAAASSNGGGAATTAAAAATAAAPDAELTLAGMADRVVFMGDMNYRVRGNRAAVDQLLAHNMHDVMLHNDQLKWSMQQHLLPAEFVEPPLNFRPTYKFDLDSDVYDTGSKARIPAWCDRVLYVERGLRCVAYDADLTLRTSDHRPVFATFIADVDVGEEDCLVVEEGGQVSPRAIPEFSSESQVCAIM